MNFRSRIIDLHIIDASSKNYGRLGCSEAIALQFRLRDTDISIVPHVAWDEKSLPASADAGSGEEIGSVLHFTHSTCHLGLAFLAYSSSQPQTIANVQNEDQIPIFSTYFLPFLRFLTIAISQAVKTPQVASEMSNGLLAKAFGV
jgi:hypothetical protein